MRHSSVLTFLDFKLARSSETCSPPPPSHDVDSFINFGRFTEIAPLEKSGLNSHVGMLMES